jgi:SAM-dependent methyltransferase
VATATERRTREREFHDRQARERAERFHSPDAYRVDANWYLDHESWIRPAFAKLGNLRDRRVLDLGCGHGMAAVVLAGLGARVTALELSADYLREAGRRAAANGVHLDLVQADGETLPFADGAFDRVWGNAILHHLDAATACRELRRVLAPGGVAVFCEPWGETPLLRLARRHLGYPGKERTVDEQPLERRQLRLLHDFFPGLTVEGFQLLAMLRRLLPGRLSSLNRCDTWLLRHHPALRRYCRYVVITLPRDR